MTVIELGIDHLEGISQIGRGGFSVVYAATDTRLDRQVAVKVLAQPISDGDRRRFDRECRVMARLSDHPNVVTLYDAGYCADGSPYLVMELVRGGNLGQRVERTGPLGWREAVDHVIPVARALARSHSLGILHRDVKPQNILLADGTPKLTDFGIAYLRDATGSTATSVTASWLHTAPETFANDRDERSDLYSLASTLYTLIAGHEPFWRPDDDSLSPLMFRLMTEPPPPLPVDLAPESLVKLVSRALAKEPRHRPRTCAAFATLLINLRDEPDRRPPPAPSPLVGVAPAPPLPPRPASSGVGVVSSPGRPPAAPHPPAPPPPAPGRPVVPVVRRNPVASRLVVVGSAGAALLVSLFGMMLVVRADGPSTATPAYSEAATEVWESTTMGPPSAPPSLREQDVAPTSAPVPPSPSQEPGESGADPAGPFVAVDGPVDAGSAGVHLLHALLGLAVDAYVDDQLVAADLGAGEPIGSTGLAPGAHRLLLYQATGDPAAVAVDRVDPILAAATVFIGPNRTTVAARGDGSGGIAVSTFDEGVGSIDAGRGRLAIRLLLDEAATQGIVSVFIDGEPAGDLGPGDEVVIDVTPGATPVELVGERIDVRHIIASGDGELVAVSVLGPLDGAGAASNITVQRYTGLPTRSADQTTTTSRSS